MAITALDAAAKEKIDLTVLEKRVNAFFGAQDLQDEYVGNRLSLYVYNWLFIYLPLDQLMQVAKGNFKKVGIIQQKGADEADWQDISELVRLNAANIYNLEYAAKISSSSSSIS